jgi:hypothetical protein
MLRDVFVVLFVSGVVFVVCVLNVLYLFVVFVVLLLWCVKSFVFVCDVGVVVWLLRFLERMFVVLVSLSRRGGVKK